MREGGRQGAREGREGGRSSQVSSVSDASVLSSRPVSSPLLSSRMAAAAADRYEFHLTAEDRDALRGAACSSGDDDGDAAAGLARVAGRLRDALFGEGAHGCVVNCTGTKSRCGMPRCVCAASSFSSNCSTEPMVKK